MKAHLLQVLVVDDNYIGLDEIIRVFEQDTDYRDLINPCVITSQSVEIENDSLLTHNDTQAAEVDRLFRQTLRPMKDAPIDRREYVLLFGESGYITTPLRCEVCRYSSWGGWTNHAGDLFLAGGSEPVGWLPLPSAR